MDFRRLAVTLPETNITPENGWLEYSFPFGSKGLFSGAFAVSSREGNHISPPCLYFPHCLHPKKKRASRCAGRKCFTASKRMPVTPQKKTQSFEGLKLPFFTENGDSYPQKKRENGFTFILETQGRFFVRAMYLNLWEG